MCKKHGKKQSTVGFTYNQHATDFSEINISFIYQMMFSGNEII